MYRSGKEVDIANLTFRRLPPEFQEENLRSTDLLCKCVEKQFDLRSKDKNPFDLPPVVRTLT